MILFCADKENLISEYICSDQMMCLFYSTPQEKQEKLGLDAICGPEVTETAINADGFRAISPGLA